MKKTQLIALLLVVCLFAGCSFYELDNEDSSRKTFFGAEESVPAQTCAPVTEPSSSSQTAPPTTDAPPSGATPVQIPAESAGYSAVYQDICQFLRSGDSDQAYQFVTTGIKETRIGTSSEAERFAAISYALQDLNGDGVQEMIVLDPHWTLPGNSRILAIYTLLNNTPTLMAEGWSRSRLYLLQDGTFYKEGSSGAAFSCYETLILQGTALSYTGLWFTYPKGETQIQGGYYYNTTGEYSVEASTEITSEEYTLQQEKLQQEIVTFPSYSFL